jgi:hypothetical protein
VYRGIGDDGRWLEERGLGGDGRMPAAPACHSTHSTPINTSWACERLTFMYRVLGSLVSLCGLQCAGPQLVWIATVFGL